MARSIIKEPHQLANFFMLFIFSSIILFGLARHYIFENTNNLTYLLSSHWSNVIAQIFVFIVPLLIFVNLSRTAYMYEVFPKERLGFVNIVLIIGIAFLIQPVLMLITSFSSSIFYNPVPTLITTMAVLPFPTILFIVAIVPSICEELVFRGFIQTHYKRLPIIFSAFANGLFFAMVHFNWVQFIYAFICGVLFAYMVHITKSIYSAMLAHFIANSTQISIGYIITVTEGLYTPSIIWDLIMLVAFILFGNLVISAAITLPLVVMLLYIFSRRNKQRLRDKEEDYEVERSALAGFKKYLDITFFAVIVFFIAIKFGF
ncbi:MAG: CPBP family intramembrane metalloprotease [Turicibacter sp.]|nr:CPBP family intramembrane metalloprotease [Turicibacter sp.]